jgi:hypothetical protein
MGSYMDGSIIGIADACLVCLILVGLGSGAIRTAHNFLFDKIILFLKSLDNYNYLNS